VRDLVLHRCHTCNKHLAGKLHRFEDRWYCTPHWREALEWHETRSNLALALATGAVCGVSVTVTRDPVDRHAAITRVRVACDQIEFALLYNLPRQFVRGFIDAMWAWEELR